jgi:membrane associated rhomboid family serine protease
MRSLRATSTAIAILGATYVLELSFPVRPPSGVTIDESTLVALGGVEAPFIRGGQFYRFALSPLLHADPVHLTSNLLVLALLGLVVERYLGSLGVGVLLAAGAVGGSLTSFLVHATLSVGFSGAISGLAAGSFTFSLNHRGSLREPNKVRLLALLFFVAPLLGAAFQNNKVVDQAAHIGGGISGLVASALLMVPPSVRRSTRLQIFILSACAAGIVWGLVAVSMQWPSFVRVLRDQNWFMPTSRPARVSVDSLALSHDPTIQFPRDPRAHLWVAQEAELNGDVVKEEHELRLALADPEVFAVEYPDGELELQIRTTLARILLEQEDRRDAVEVALPVCHAGAFWSIPSSLQDLNLCDGLLMRR